MVSILAACQTTRFVINRDALEWLAEFQNSGLPGEVFISIPDLSGLDQFGVLKHGTADVKGFKNWFQSVVELILLGVQYYCNRTSGF